MQCISLPPWLIASSTWSVDNFTRHSTTVLETISVSEIHLLTERGLTVDIINV